MLSENGATELWKQFHIDEAFIALAITTLSEKEFILSRGKE